MRRNWIAACVFAVIFFAPLTSNYPARAQGAKIQFHETRVSPSDLELAGDIAGVPRGATVYARRSDLVALPQTNFTVTDDSNFNEPTKVRGVLLEDLLRDLSAAPGADMVVAICSDKYHANYPREYIAAHHPLLVLEVNGKPPEGWPKDSSGSGLDMGPYMVSHGKFTPSFKILAHQDEAQIPWGVIRLEFRDQKEVFGSTGPRGQQANDANVLAGNRIAQQNCFRCHNSGGEGGRKSGVSWTALGALAAGSPEFFTEYVRDPASKNPKTQMAASPEYDDATMRALIEYFSTFAPSEAR
jgi:mono/diheme cytochrome c family protein